MIPGLKFTQALNATKIPDFHRLSEKEYRLGVMGGPTHQNKSFNVNQLCGWINRFNGV